MRKNRNGSEIRSSFVGGMGETLGLHQELYFYFREGEWILFWSVWRCRRWNFNLCLTFRVFFAFERLCFEESNGKADTIMAVE